MTASAAQKHLQISPQGDACVRVRWTSASPEEASAGLHRLMNELVAHKASAAFQNGLMDVVMGLDSLSVYYRPDQISIRALTELLLQKFQGQALADFAQRVWTLPVCREANFAPDWDALCRQSARSPEEVQHMLEQSVFRVRLIGFMPGFPYMDGVPECLSLPRLPKPRTAVPAGSVAVTGRMCGIYPWNSPGGWNLIGRTPVPLFDVCHPEPCLLQVGDAVRLRWIGEDDFRSMQSAVQAGELQRTEWMGGFE
jgi:inhibitor of KinA